MNGRFEGDGPDWLLMWRLTHPAFQRDSLGVRCGPNEHDVIEIGWRAADQMAIENDIHWSALDDAIHHQHLLGEQ